MDMIDLRDIPGFERDDQALRDFERPFLLPSLLGLAMTLSGMLLLIAEDTSSNRRPVEETFLNRIWSEFKNGATDLGLGPTTINYLPITFFFGGMVLFLITILCMARSTPISKRSNQKMEKYWNAHPDPGSKEMVYVDRPSRTFFTRVFSTYRRE